jgi:hypothetical protein
MDDIDNISDTDEDVRIITDILGNNIFNSDQDDDRITYIFNNNHHRYTCYMRMGAIAKKEPKVKVIEKVRIDFRNKRELSDNIFQNKIDHVKLFKKILEKRMKIDESLEYITGVFQSYNLTYDNLISDIIIKSGMTVEDIKKVMLAYSRNNNISILLWNYLINSILMHEERCDIKYWIEIYINIIDNLNFFDLFTGFLYCKNIVNHIGEELLIEGKYDMFQKIKGIYEIHIRDPKKVLLKCLRNYRYHQSYQSVKQIADKIQKYTTTYGRKVIDAFYKSYYAYTPLSNDEEKTIVYLHKKFKNRDMIVSSPKHNSLSIPMFLLECRKPSLELLKFLHTKRTTYMINQYTIYHLISNINLEFYTDDEIINILDYYSNILKLPFLYYDKINMSPLSYLIENSSIKVSMIEYYSKYEDINTAQAPYSTLEQDYSKEYLYTFMTNTGLKATMIYELISKKVIDVRKINEKGENIIMMFAQNVNNFDSTKNEEMLSIYMLLLRYVDVNHVDLEGNNILAMVCSMENPELMKKLIILFGFELLNIPNHNGITPLFKLANTIYDNKYMKNEEVLNWLLDLNIILKFNIETPFRKKSIFEYIVNRNVAMKIVKYMIEYDSNNLYNFVTEDGDNNILLMTLRGVFNMEMYKLIGNKIDYKLKNKWGYDIFLATCEFGYYNVLKKIYECANLANKTEHGENALHVVCYRDNNVVKEKIIKFLLLKGIDHKIRDNMGCLFYSLLYKYEAYDRKIFNNLIKEKYIDVNSDEFIQFVLLENISEFKEKYNISIKEINYEKNVDDCAICRDEIKNGDKFYICSEGEIKHGYHKDCFDKWIEQSKKPSCLLCMKEIYVYKGYYIKI